MPFTPAHAAIVLPFVNASRFVSATALVIGSVAPDFEYFFKMGVDSRFSHTLLGVLWFDVPVVLLLALIFHQIVKNNLIRNLPAFLQVRCYPLMTFDFLSALRKQAMPFVVCAALGALSHLFWDAFTHGDGYFVKTLSFYKGAYVPLDGANYPLWYALQHISTFVGLTILFVYIAFMKRHVHGVVYQVSWRYWIYLLLITVVAVGLRFLVKSSDYHLGNFVVTVISGFCIALVVTGLMRFKNDLVRY